MNRITVSVLFFVSVAGVSGHVARAQTLQTEMVQVDADTALATDVWLPAGEMPDEGWPVILRRTPYGRVMAEGDVSGFSALGYVYVSQDVRGRGASEGDFLPFLTDAADGRAAIEWAASQPWSNGRVCTWGGSAEGVVQLMAAGEGPTGLVGMIPLVATDDVYEGMMGGGVWRKELTTAWLHGLDAPAVFAEWRENEGAGPYWDRGRLTPEERARIDFPILIIGGFFDIFAHSQLRMHGDFQDQVAPGARRDQYIIMGPWTHGGLMFDEDKPVMEGEVEYIRGAAYDMIWFDLIDFLEFTLKGGERPVWAPVRYFRTRLSGDGFHADGSWRAADRWPPVGQEWELTPGADGALTRGSAPQEPSWVEIPVDPNNPVPSEGGGNLTTPAGIFDQSEIDSRPDVAYFQTEPAAVDTVIEGDVVARLRVVFSGTDGDVVVRLSQVTPSGSVMLLADGAIRARFIMDPVVATAVVPGQAYDIRVRLSPVAIELPAGHSIRMSIAGTSSPRYEPNPGELVALSDSDRASIAGNLKVMTGVGGLTVNVVQGEPWPDVSEPVDGVGDVQVAEEPALDVVVVPEEAAPDVVVRPEDAGDAVQVADTSACESGEPGEPCECPDPGCSSGHPGSPTVFFMLAAVSVLLAGWRRGRGTGRKMP